MKNDLTYFFVGSNRLKFDEIEWYSIDKFIVLGVKGNFHFSISSIFKMEKFSLEAYKKDINYLRNFWVTAVDKDMYKNVKTTKLIE